MSATGVSLLATQIRRVDPIHGAPRTGWDGRLLLPGLYLVGALLIGAAVIAMVNRWRRVPRSETVTASEQLTEFRTLYENGQMSREEFERVRTLLSTQIRGPEAAPTAPATAAIAPVPLTATPAPPPPAEVKPADEPPPDSIRPA
jgi:hypothetical protein